MRVNILIYVRDDKYQHNVDASMDFHVPDLTQIDIGDTLQSLLCSTVAEFQRLQDNPPKSE